MRVPLHHARVAFSSSTRNSHTVSGLAAIASSRSTDISVAASMLSPLLSLGLALEGVEALVPEPVQELLQLHEPFRACAVKPSRAVAPLAHEPCLLEDVQVLGD